jgi:hypothetical protein
MTALSTLTSVLVHPDCLYPAAPEIRVEVFVKKSVAFEELAFDEKNWFAYLIGNADGSTEWFLFDYSLWDCVTNLFNPVRSSPEWCVDSAHKLRVIYADRCLIFSRDGLCVTALLSVTHLGNIPPGTGSNG